MGALVAGSVAPVPSTSRAAEPRLDCMAGARATQPRLAGWGHASQRLPIAISRGGRPGRAAAVRPTAAATVKAEKCMTKKVPTADELLPNKDFGMEGRTFREKFDVRSFEIDHSDKRASITTMTNLLQECAANHTYGLWGRGTDGGYATDPIMEEDSLAFVLQRMMVRFVEYPTWTDRVQVETWFAESGRIGARRDWEVTDCRTGKVLGGGTSNWVLLNLKKRKLARMPEELRLKNIDRSPQPEKWALGEGVAVKKIPDVDLEADGVRCVGMSSLMARRSDMDMNGHVNNVTYIDWALESVPQEQLDSHSVAQVEIEYKNECMVGECIETISCLQVEAREDGLVEYTHVVRKEACKTELVVARTLWAAKAH